MIISNTNEKKLSALASALKENIPIRDRKHHFRNYPSTFLGRDALEWLISSKNASSMAEAKQMGNILISAGYFHHVHDEHTLKDENLFYRFYEDEKDHSVKEKLKHEELSVPQQVALLELQLNEKNVELSSIYKRLQKNEDLLWDLKNSIIQANFFIGLFSYATSFMGLCLMYLMFNAYVFFSLFLLMSPFLFKTAVAISIMEVIYSYLGYDMSAKKKVVEKKILKPLEIG